MASAKPHGGREVRRYTQRGMRQALDLASSPVECSADAGHIHSNK